MMKMTSLLQFVDRLQRTDKIDNLEMSVAFLAVFIHQDVTLDI